MCRIRRQPSAGGGQSGDHGSATWSCWRREKPGDVWRWRVAGIVAAKKTPEQSPCAIVAAGRGGPELRHRQGSSCVHIEPRSHLRPHGVMEA